ncbi:hypothetical protein [Paracoccus mutanolyticus]|uniref:hypothetical protein n=1 Tax=Paracoccus mutanolyticus TaxID=1499308 RepID=UPI001677CB6B|nr:hypothetical protein [Paracoccus mutanolyticus]
MKLSISDMGIRKKYHQDFDPAVLKGKDILAVESVGGVLEEAYDDNVWDTVVAASLETAMPCRKGGVP